MIQKRQPKPCKGCGEHQKRPTQMRTDGGWSDEQTCMECVEKHLGAALVMFGEIRNGYKNRMKVVGHLFKAEHESADCEKLSDLIRDARRRYQATNVEPDWEVLETALIEARKNQ